MLQLRFIHLLLADPLLNHGGSSAQKLNPSDFLLHLRKDTYLPVPRCTSIKGKNKERYEILQSRKSFKNLRICSENLDLLIVRLFEL